MNFNIKSIQVLVITAHLYYANSYPEEMACLVSFYKKKSWNHPYLPIQFWFWALTRSFNTSLSLTVRLSGSDIFWDLCGGILVLVCASFLFPLLLLVEQAAVVVLELLFFDLAEELLLVSVWWCCVDIIH